MSTFIDLTGQLFGSLIVIKRATGNDKRNGARWLCVCICGKEKIISSNSLRTGNTITCGHLEEFCKRGHLRSPENLTTTWGCRECCNEAGKTAYSEDVEGRKRRSIKYNDHKKLEALTHYGPNSTLGCCWDGCTVTDIDMLSLDHKDDNGSKHRQRSGSRQGGVALYVWAMKNNWPNTLQTLCMNHQWKKRMIKHRVDREKRTQ